VFFSEHGVDTLCSEENTHMFVYIFHINVWIAVNILKEGFQI